MYIGSEQGGRNLLSFGSYKESPYPPGNGFSRALESRFLVPKIEAQCSHFRLMGALSLDVVNLISKPCKYLRYENEEEKL